MKPNRIGITLFVAIVTMTSLLPAQNGQQTKDHHYSLVDLGTLGGPNSYLPLLPPYHDFLPSPSLSEGGTFAGYADTAGSDPYCFNEDCHVSHAISWRHGVRTDLGTIPDGSGSNSAATWISKNGLIAGVSENGQIDPLTGFPSIFAVLWRKGQITNLGTLEGGYNSAATALNDARQVVGFFTNTVSDPNSLLGTTTEARAFLWQHGTMQDLGTLPGGTDAMALFINERGQVVGQSYSANSIVPPAIGCTDSPLTLYGFFWEKGKMRDIGTLGGSCAFPYSLNNRGEVVGQSNTSGDVSSHPFFWRPGSKMKDLGALGGNYGYAEWLNDHGMVVGSATNAGDQALLAFQWEGGTMTNLGTLEGDACSAADAINSQGLVVGGSGFNATPYFPACTDLVEHAVLWDHGQIVDLNNFVPPGYDLTLIEAWFINDRGEIAGVGIVSNGNQHAFLLVPCDGTHSNCQDAKAETAFSPSSSHSAAATEYPPAARGAGSLGPSIRRRLPSNVIPKQTGLAPKQSGTQSDWLWGHDGSLEPALFGGHQTAADSAHFEAPDDIGGIFSHSDTLSCGCTLPRYTCTVGHTTGCHLCGGSTRCCYTECYDTLYKRCCRK